MNSYYASIITDYVDPVDCNFQYTLAWYQDHGFELFEKEMMFVNDSTPKCLINTAHNPDLFDLSLFIQYSMKTDHQLDWVLNHWEDKYWDLLSDNKFITTDQWVRILKHRIVPAKHLKQVMKNPYFPWFLLGQHLINTFLADIACNHAIIDPAKSPHNDWFWEIQIHGDHDNLFNFIRYWRLFGNTSLSVDFFKRYTPAIIFLGTSKAYQNIVLDEKFWTRVIKTYPIDWRSLSEHPSLPVTFWEEHLKKVHWRMLCRCNRVLTTAFLMKHLDRIEWDELATNAYTPSDFWTKGLHKYLNAFSEYTWEFLCHNPSVPGEFIEECIRKYDDVVWDPQSARCSLAFWEERGQEGRTSLYANAYVLKLVMKRELCRFLTN